MNGKYTQHWHLWQYKCRFTCVIIPVNSGENRVTMKFDAGAKVLYVWYLYGKHIHQRKEHACSKTEQIQRMNMFIFIWWWVKSFHLHVQYSRFSGFQLGLWFCILCISLHVYGKSGHHHLPHIFKCWLRVWLLCTNA